MKLKDLTYDEKLVTVKDEIVSTEEYPHNITLFYMGEGKFMLMGNLEHNSIISISDKDMERLLQLRKAK